MESKEVELISYGSMGGEKAGGVDNTALHAEGEQELQGPVVSYSVVDDTVKTEKPGLAEEPSVGFEAVEGTSDPEKGGVGSVHDKPYAGMGKEDLLRFSDTPFWNRFRLISILIFWAAWLALLGAVIGLTIVAPRCDDRPTPSWWQKSVVYQIYVRSFYDSGDDGVGDIRGVIQKLDYLEELNIGVILLSSIYESMSGEKPDYGYEVLNHTAVRSEYGTVADVVELIQAAHNRSMAVILDFIPNYTGTEHPWFQTQNDSSYDNPYWNYYVWADCRSKLPNNWRSVYGEVAWNWHEGRQSCYLHQFLNSTPELNLRSTAVQAELEHILRFWLDKGVDGFRVIGSDFLMESQDLQDEEPVECDPNGNEYDCLDHSFTRSQPENVALIARWREIVDQYTINDPSRERILITDGNSSSVDKVLRYYGRKSEGANLPINYQLSKLPINCTGQCISNLVKNFTDSLKESDTPAWLISDQDGPRLLSRFGPAYSYAAMLLQFTLPGTSLVYYGDELGMEDFLSNNPIRDPAGDIDPDYSRDPHRSPMQWNNRTESAGFTNNSQPWLEVNPNYQHVNAEDLAAVENSTLNFFKSLAKLKKDQESFQYGATHYLSGFDENLIAYVREHEGFDRYLTVINFGAGTVGSADVTRDRSSIKLPNKAEVVLSTHSTVYPWPGDEIDLRKVSLEKGQGFLAKWEYSRP